MEHQFENSEQLLTEDQAGSFLNLSVRTLQAWRHRGGGPQFVRISSRAVRYRMADLRSFTEAKIVSSTSQATKSIA
ncbi:MAG: helix-turn-helix domain-containing protein [Bdellovibrionota bacterium]